jgi:hypothetical protein
LPEDDIVVFCGKVCPETKRAAIETLVPGVMRDENGQPIADVETYVTPEVGPHTDDLPFQYTVGLVLDGDHILKNSRNNGIGALQPGVVYFLDNRSLHGAQRARPDAPKLWFLTIDFAAYDLRDAVDRIRVWK